MAANVCATAMFLLLLICVLAGVCSGSLCRTCTYSSNSDNDDACVTAPKSLTGPGKTYHCDRLCTVQETYSLEEGKISSIERTCSSVEKSGYCEKGIWHITCYYSCLGNLCNDFSGLNTQFPIISQGSGNTDGDNPVAWDGEHNGSVRALRISGLCVVAFMFVLAELLQW